MMKKQKIIVSGRVQGVGFRYYTQKQAARIGIRGYVKNLYNGNVEVYAAGTEEQLTLLKQYLKTGPSLSHVDSIHVEDLADGPDFHSFEITF